MTFHLNRKLILERLQLQLVEGFIINFSVFSQNKAILGNSNYYQGRMMQMKKFSGKH